MRAPMSQYPALSLAQPHFFSYALGWFVQDYHGETVWMHTGSIDGMCAIIGLLPERHMGVYVLENVDHAELRHALMYEVFDMYIRRAVACTRATGAGISRRSSIRCTRQHTPQPRRRPPRRRPKRAPIVAAGALRWQLCRLDLRQHPGDERDGALRARFVNFDIGELKHASYETFRSVKDDALEGVTELTFVPDGSGAGQRRCRCSARRSHDRQRSPRRSDPRAHSPSSRCRASSSW